MLFFFSIFFEVKKRRAKKELNKLEDDIKERVYLEDLERVQKVRDLLSTGWMRNPQQ
jgi:hypothetical protein